MFCVNRQRSTFALNPDPPSYVLTILMASSRSLPYGKFFGAPGLCCDVPGFSIAVMKATLRDEEVPLHTHEDASLVLLLDGTYISSAADADSEMGPMAVIYNPPSTTHRDRFKSLDGHFLAMSVSRETFRSAGDWTSFPRMAQTYTSRTVVATAVRLAAECRCWRQESPLLAEAICLELLGQIAAGLRPLRGKPPAWLQWAKELMRDRCADHLRLAEVAHSVGVHPVHLARGFRQLLGCTPGEYLMRCRMEKAVTLLRGTDIALAEAALQAGFFDQSHLSNAFRRHFGVSPRAYRRSVRTERRTASSR